MSLPTKGLIFFGGQNTSTSLLSGNGAPSAGTGGPYDWYLDVTDSRLYGPKDPSTGWPSTYIDLSGIASASAPLVFDASTQTISLDPIGTADISNDAVTQDKLADDSVGSAQLQADSVGSSEIAADAVGSSEIAADAVGTSEIADDAVTEAKLADNSVDSAQIKSNAVGSDEIATDAVGSDEIAAGAVGSSELASGAVTSAKIGSGAVDLTKLSSGVASALVPNTGKVNGYIFVTDGTNHGWYNPALATYQQSQIVGLSTTLAGKADLVGGKLKSDQIPNLAITSVFTAANEAAQLALTTEEGDVVVRSDENKSYIRNSGTAGTMADFTELKTPTDSVLSVNGETGAVTLTAADVGAAEAVHTHTKSDITDFAHTHSLADITDAGTAAGKDAPASGDASSTQVVLGDDSRLTDQRTPSNDSVTTAKIADSAVTSAKINNGAVSSEKLASAVSSQLIPSGGSNGQVLSKTSSGYEFVSVEAPIARQTLEQSVTVAAGSEVSVDLALAKTFMVTKIVSSKPCRFRLYNTAASRTADTSRASTSVPAPDSGLIMEAIFTSDLLSLPVFPAQTAQNQESTPSSTMKALVRNDGTGADLTLTITYVPLED